MAKLRITFERAILSNGYLLYVDVHAAPDTYPADLQKCIVLHNDEIARIADLTDFEALDEAGYLLYLESTGFGTGGVGGIIPTDKIYFESVPPQWTELGFSAPQTFIVNSVYSHAGVPYAVLVSSVLPAPCNDPVTFRVKDALNTTKFTVTDTIVKATRKEPSHLAVDDGRIFRAATMFDDIVAANNKLVSLRAEAQALVGNADIDEESFSGISTEDFD
jgi:hypothetical protein